MAPRELRPGAGTLRAVPEPEATDDVRAADGRIPGRRGLATRARLLTCTADMLKTGSYRDLKVIDIAREAGTSPATFYQYFPDVQAAILALAEDMATDIADLSEFIRDAAWKGRTGHEVAEALADRFLRHWDEHRAILRVVDMAAGEGDGRFTQIRVRMLNGVTMALDEVIRHRQGDAKGQRDPMATAGVLVAMLAHVSAHRYGFEFWGIRTSDTRQAMAQHVYWGVTGQCPPA